MGDIDQQKPARRRISPWGVDSQPDQERVPGWYRDPDAPRFHRYWDGRQWHLQRPSPPDMPPTEFDGLQLPRPRPRS